jgi:UDP-glucose 4-epimerase
MNTLILGGNGFIGSHLIDKLLSEGHKVRVFDKYEERYRKPLASVEYHYGDFGNRGLLTDAVQNIDVVYHLISTTLPKTSNDDPVFDVQSNVIETLFLLEQCVTHKVTKIVFISSGGTVYGNPHKLPVSEDAQTDPLCSYGIAKLTIEKYLMLFNHMYGLNYMILRPSNPYGIRQNSNGIQGAIAVFLGKIARGENVEIWGDGNVTRDFIYIKDLVDGIYKASIRDTHSRVFNLGSGKARTINEILKIIKDVTKTDVNTTFLSKRGFDVQNIFLDITRAQQELAWSPVTSLEAGIEYTWDFIRNLT